MKTIHHLIAALINAGLPDDDAINLAGECYLQPDPYAYFAEATQSAYAEIASAQRAYSALTAVLGRWNDHD